ncbi:MAG: hypothetical protein K6G01_07295 [Eubacterium sp.]|nr:hypothetical protein [Eubacterium sp.]
MKRERMTRFGIIVVMVVLLSAGCSGLLYAVLRSLNFSVDSVVAWGLFMAFAGVWGLCFFRTNTEKRNRRYRVA